MAYVLLFLVAGNILALVFASAGPAFFGRVLPGHSNPYAALMNYLHSVNASRPLLAVRDKRDFGRLLRGDTVFGWGISAMPSVHLASAVLAALFGFQLSKPVGIVLTIAAGLRLHRIGCPWLALRSRWLRRSRRRLSRLGGRRAV